MPICTSCTFSVPYLYTVYESEDNLRLEKCPNPSCGEFADPYVEHDALTILLDLVLLKLGVYRHLLYNRGAPPRELRGNDKKNDDQCAERVDRAGTHSNRWILLFKLGSALILADAFIRYNYLDIHVTPPSTTRWTRQSALAFARVLLGTIAETVAFHGGITLTCYVLMNLMTLVQLPRTGTQSSIRKEFRLSMISFSLFYSSITKLFLLFLLTIWLPTSHSMPHMTAPLPEWVHVLSGKSQDILKQALELLDDDKLDREWIVRNILGGMCAGFGLRVILDIHPIFSTVVILAGWVAKTVVATLLSGWVGGNQVKGEAWLAYSIP